MARSSDIVRLVIAVALPPVAIAALAGATLSAIVFCLEYTCNAVGFAYGALMGAVVGVAFGIPTAALIGLPAHHLLLRAGKTRAIFYALAGAVIGAPAAMLVGAVSSPGAFEAPLGAWATMSVIGLVIGALTAVCFWFIRRPDRIVANPARAAP